MTIREIQLNSWAEYKTRIIKDLFPDGVFQRGKFLFRGQGGHDWRLISNFDRWYKGPKSEKFKVAEQLLDQFTKECEAESLPEVTRSDRSMMLGLAQHHGLPTRMLDWSESPYVSAFFAFSGHIRSGIDPQGSVAVWVLNSASHIWNRENGCEILDVPSFGNERIRNQHGKFTYLRSPFDTLEEYTASFSESDLNALSKYMIPTKDVVAAMADLDSMGLNHARIYPGISGNAKAAEVRVLLGLLR